LEFDEPTFTEVVMASCTVPHVEVTLKDRSGKELDGQETVGVFWESGSGPFSVSPFRNPTLVSVYYGGDPADYVKNKGNYRDEPVLLTAYVVGAEGSLASAFTKEFIFNMPLEQVEQLKKVEVAVLNRSNPVRKE